MTPVELAVRGAATWRVTHMLMYEAGPKNLILEMRSRFGVAHDKDGLPVGYPDGSVFECFLCCSVWVALGVAFAPFRALQPLAISAVAIWAQGKYYGKS